MQGIIYNNGRYEFRAHAHVSMDDRGYHFADGIYEAIAVRDGVLLDGELHFDRLERSLKELDIAAPMSRAAIKQIIKELLRRNMRLDGVIYMQITRGVCQRNHLYPDGMKPVMTMMITNAKFRSEVEVENGIKIVTVPDDRWARCDIKSIALLPNMLARNVAQRQGAKEAWQIRDGVITEGSLSNAYIVDESGVVRTHPADKKILGGVRRHMVLKLARENGIEVREEAFTMEDVKNAKEAFLSSCSNYITPIVQVDDLIVGGGNGTVGEVTQKLMALFDAHIDAMIKRGWVS